MSGAADSGKQSRVALSEFVLRLRHQPESRSAAKEWLQQARRVREAFDANETRRAEDAAAWADAIGCWRWERLRRRWATKQGSANSQKTASEA